MSGCLGRLQKRNQLDQCSLMTEDLQALESHLSDLALYYAILTANPFAEARIINWLKIVSSVSAIVENNFDRIEYIKIISIYSEIR